MHIQRFSEKELWFSQQCSLPSYKLPTHVGRYFLKLATGEGAGGLSLGNRSVTFAKWRSLDVCYPGVHVLSIFPVFFIPLKRADSGGRVRE